MKLFRRVFSSQLARGSVLVFVGTNIGNFLNFLYNIIIGRLLGPEKYGDLGAILSTISIFGVALSIFSLFTIKQVSSYWGKNEKGKIVSFLNYFTSKLFIFSIIGSLLLLLITPNIGHFLHLDNLLPVFIVAISFVLSGPATITRSVLQGTLSFFYVTINGIGETGMKLLISVILVLLNFGLTGALFGVLIGGIVGFLMSVVELKIILRDVKMENSHFLHFRTILKTFLPVILASLVMTFFLNIDIILVRHFFQAQVAGEYVALSTVGKISFYLISTIITVMFPVVSTRVSSGASYILPLLGTLVASLCLSIVVIFVYFISPKLIIGILYGEKYFGVIPYLIPFSFFIAIYSLNAVMTYFLLSISYYRAIYILFPVSLFQGLLIFIFHSSIIEIIWINILVSLVYLFVTLLFIFKKEYNVFLKILATVTRKSIYESAKSI